LVAIAVIVLMNIRDVAANLWVSRIIGP